MLSPQPSTSRLANIAADIIYQSFCNYRAQFQSVTRRAKARFIGREWHQSQKDSADRLALYKKYVSEMIAELNETLPEELAEDKMLWCSMKAVYSGLITGRADWDLAETFFNSATRRIFSTAGVDGNIEFVDTDFATPPASVEHPVYQSFHDFDSTAELLKSIFRISDFSDKFRSLEADAALAAEVISEKLREIAALKTVSRAEIVDAVFYRGKWAYQVGRIFSGSHDLPVVFAFESTAEGVVLDAVLLEEDDISIIFSFTRSYFHVDTSCYYDLVHYLKTVMPRKRLAELYISVGENKHGKTELYRHLMHYMAHSDDLFEIAPGKRGMVMTVFTLPGYAVVFKVIKDHFTYPKKVSHREVMERYHLVFGHDRAGRLADAQEFEFLKFDKNRFSDELLEILQEDIASKLIIDDDSVVIKHAYIERRMIPLDIYAREAEESAAIAAAIDYGRAIKDLAATNIFPGDMMLKNFGVTRHGRVVFYDYDELCLLTDCNFRYPPKAPSIDELMSDEPWFVVAENDIFPQEFRHFLGLAGILLRAFIEHHEDIFEVEFWQDLQNRIGSGDIIFTLPYPEEHRLIHHPAKKSQIKDNS